jgi:hypothetical protein
MMNTTPQILTQRLLSPAFPFRQRAIGSDGLAFWISLQRQRLARDEVESVEEKTFAFATSCRERLDVRCKLAQPPW